MRRSLTQVPLLVAILGLARGNERVIVSKNCDQQVADCNSNDGCSFSFVNLLSDDHYSLTIVKRFQDKYPPDPHVDLSVKLLRSVFECIAANHRVVSANNAHRDLDILDSPMPQEEKTEDVLSKNDTEKSEDTTEAGNSKVVFGGATSAGSILFVSFLAIWYKRRKANRSQTKNRSDPNGTSTSNVHDPSAPAFGDLPYPDLEEGCGPREIGKATESSGPISKKKWPFKIFMKTSEKNASQPEPLSQPSSSNIDVESRLNSTSQCEMSQTSSNNEIVTPVENQSNNEKGDLYNNLGFEGSRSSRSSSLVKQSSVNLPIDEKLRLSSSLLKSLPIPQDISILSESHHWDEECSIRSLSRASSMNDVRKYSCDMLGVLEGLGEGAPPWAKEVTNLAKRVAQLFGTGTAVCANCRGITWWAIDIQAAIESVLARYQEQPRTVFMIDSEFLDAAEDSLHELVALSKQHMQGGTLPLFALLRHTKILVDKTSNGLIKGLNKLELTQYELDMLDAPVLIVDKNAESILTCNETKSPKKKKSPKKGTFRSLQNIGFS